MCQYGKVMNDEAMQVAFLLLLDEDIYLSICNNIDITDCLIRMHYDNPLSVQSGVTIK
jgi:hypothetical protein